MYFIINLSFHFKKVLKIIKYLCIAFYCLPSQAEFARRSTASNKDNNFYSHIFVSLPKKNNKKKKTFSLNIRKFCTFRRKKERKLFILHRDIWNFPPEKIFERENFEVSMKIIIVIKIYFAFRLEVN